ncbi:MAG: zinc ABC transporter substrate-binding protein [Methanomicrobiales archaeon]|nr:zinc ABC transporter substrate-binding protein [Methanomicrobiales archaeon]
MQSDIIPNRIQLQRDFIATADLFVAHNGSVDQSYVMPYVTDFMKANGYGNVSWKTLKNPSMVWNTPGGAKNLSREVAGWLIEADAANRTYYETRLQDFLTEIEKADLTPDERARISGQQVVVMIWQKEAAEEWLGLNVVTVFAPEFYQQGKFMPRAVVNDIWNNPEKYRDVRYVIENMQSGDMAKGVEEALRDNKINAKRVVFTNFPKSIPGVESLPDVIRYNKALVTPPQQETTPVTTMPSTPLSLWLVPVSLASLILLAVRSRK